MRITRVYTRTGDTGKTRLAGGREVWKDALRVEAYGSVDELNALIGLVRVFNKEDAGGNGEQDSLEDTLRWVQNKMFDIGGILATGPGESLGSMPVVTATHVRRMEGVIDECQKDLQPLKEFILPGGGKVSGFLHQARTVCRRVERVCVRLSREEPVDPLIVQFLNRLSDLLFVMARWVAKTRGETEFLWEREPDRPGG